MYSNLRKGMLTMAEETRGFGSSEAASMGGEARAKSLTPQERSEIARHAVLMRWRKQGKLTTPVPRATHQGDMQFGEQSIPCAVLNDGTRLITQFGFLKAIGRSGRPAAGYGGDSFEELPPFLASNNLKGFISQELLASSRPMLFQMLGGGKAHGYR